MSAPRQIAAILGALLAGALFGAALALVQVQA